jgi:hypothetical protein
MNMKAVSLTPLCAGLVIGLAFAMPALAKLPAPSDEAKAKAAEAAAKAAHGGKVAAFALCKTQDRVAAGYFAKAKLDGKAAPAAAATPACADPGAFVYKPAGAAPAAMTAAPAPAAKK